MRFLGEHIDRIDPEFASWVAVLAGTLAEHGADPAPVLLPILACLKIVAEASTYFVGAWRDATDAPLPERAELAYGRVHRLLQTELGDATAVVLEAWTSLPRWAGAARAVLGRAGSGWQQWSEGRHLVRVLTAAARYCPELREVRTLVGAPLT